MDPIADQFAFVSTYNYAENEPISSIDLHGLQKYVVINNYNANRQLSSTIISTVKNKNALVNWQANGNNIRNIPADILMINQGNLPADVRPHSVSNKFAPDQQRIYDAGVDDTQLVDGNKSQGMAVKGAFRFPGTFPEEGQNYMGQRYIGTYSDVAQSQFGVRNFPVVRDVAAGFGFETISSPTYRVLGMITRSGGDLRTILDNVQSSIDNIINVGGSVNSINVRVGTGTSLRAESLTAITNFTNTNIVNPISRMPRAINVGATFMNGISNGIQINGTVPRRVKTGTVNQRVLNP